MKIANFLLFFVIFINCSPKMIDIDLLGSKYKRLYKGDIIPNKPRLCISYTQNLTNSKDTIGISCSRGGKQYIYLAEDFEKHIELSLVEMLQSMGIVIVADIGEADLSIKILKTSGPLYKCGCQDNGYSFYSGRTFNSNLYSINNIKLQLQILQPNNNIKIATIEVRGSADPKDHYFDIGLSRKWYRNMCEDDIWSAIWRLCINDKFLKYIRESKNR